MTGKRHLACNLCEKGTAPTDRRLVYVFVPESSDVQILAFQIIIGLA